MHMDDADDGVREATCAAMEVASGKKPGCVVEACEVARATHRSGTFIDRVVARASGGSR